MKPADKATYAKRKAAYEKALLHPYDAILHATHIRAEADTMHKELLSQINDLMGADAGTPEAEELSRLAKIVEYYEEVAFPIENTREPESVSLSAKLQIAYEALDQLLDDMGDTGLCVCPAAKAKAIEALKQIGNDWVCIQSEAIK